MAKKKDEDITYADGSRVRIGISDKIIRGIGYVFVTFYAACCIFPFLIIIGTSFTSESVIRAEGVQLIPKDVSTQAYKLVINGGLIWRSYALTIILTLVGTAVGLSIIAMHTGGEARRGEL